MDAFGGAFCICCRRSLNRIGGVRRRSYTLTADFVQSHAQLMPFLVEVENMRQFNQEDKICRPCLQRAQRYDRQVNVQAAADQPAEVSANLPAEVPTNLPAEVPAYHRAQVLANLPEEVPADSPVQVSDDHDDDATVNETVRDQSVQTNRSYMVLEGYSRSPCYTHACIIAGCSNRNLQRIAIHIITLVLQDKSFYIPRGTRICEDHSSASVWRDIEQNTRRVLNEFLPAHVKDMMDILRTQKLSLDFDRLSSIKDSIFHYYIGFSKSQFSEILRNTPAISQKFKNKAGRALATVLTKLHTGDSNERLTNLFNMTRKTLEKTMKLVRSYLITEFVPRHLGYDHMSREEVMARCLSIPNALFGNPEAPISDRRAIVILDGTYIYLQKSSNYYFQRKSYSLHKYRNLLKPFLIVCPDGHILDVYGLYPATKSDATILSEIVRSYDDPFNWFFKENDVLILDRGFRDCIHDVESCGYRAYMPATKDEGENQLSVQQANESRKVTMCRWVVETINGRIKNQFRQLRSQNFNVAARHLFDHIKIAASILNAFETPLVDHRLVQDILIRIPLRDDNRNRISAYVISNNINRRRADFQTMNVEVPGIDDFPQLTADDLIRYALGTYQIEQARSYYGEHVKNGSYIIEVCKEDHLQEFENRLDAIEPWLLRGRIQSRHTSNRIYYIYILLDRGFQGPDAILGHYCSCVVGKRTLGCCSHTMSIIWFMGWGRYQEQLVPPAQFLDTVIRQDVETEVYDEPENLYST